MKFLKKYIIFVALISLISCQDEINDDTSLATKNDEIEFELAFASRATNSDNLEDLSQYFYYDDEEGKSSCLLLSQRSSSLSLNFINDESNTNCYRYTYYPNEQANWEEGYNFTSKRALTWERILANGQFSNGYAFGVLYFPRDYDYVEEINPDQSNSNNYMESDILGAWHRTSRLYDRLRFRLNHLMCKLKINLYVPVFDEKQSNGFNVDEIIASTIGFRTDYSIEWGDRITELPPIARPSASVEGVFNDIIMYKEEGPTDIQNFPLSNFNIVDLDFDHVKKYSFEVLFPEQTVKGDFLRFTFLQNKLEKHYVFNSAYLTQNVNGFAFVAGEITQLELYLPRTDNKMVLLSAVINKWNKAQASFTITSQE